MFCVYVLCARLYTTAATVASPRRAHRPSRRLNRRRSSNQRPGRSVETAETPNSIIVSGIVIVISRPIGRLTGKRTSCGSILFLLFALIVFLFCLFLFSSSFFSGQGDLFFGDHSYRYPVGESSFIDICVGIPFAIRCSCIYSNACFFTSWQASIRLYASSMILRSIESLTSLNLFENTLSRILYYYIIISVFLTNSVRNRLAL